MQSIEHDGIPTTPTTATPSLINLRVGNLALNINLALAASSTPVDQDGGGPTASGGAAVHQQGASPAARVRSNSRFGNNRIFCPVDGCPESLFSSNRHFRDFASIKIHLNDHCTGHLSGAVPVDFLSHHNYTQCSECNKVLSSRFNGVCQKCRPWLRKQQQMNDMRSRINLPNSNLQDGQQSQSDNTQRELPSLAAIHETFVPTRKNVPKVLRKLFAQCLKQALAQAVWSNNLASWSELHMLPKCTLCVPPRGGKSHISQRVTWTRARLLRWLAGERAELWFDIPQFKRPKPRKYSAEAAYIHRQERCMSLAAEGGLSNACKSLVSSTPLGHSAEVTRLLTDKHPAAEQPVDLSHFGNASSSLVPPADVDIVNKCISSFHRLSGGGPSGLRPIHIKNCLATEHRDEVPERCCALMNVLAKGEAPSVLAPFLAGATLTALPKKDDGIRPVAVGEVWRRLTSKYLCSAYKEQASSYFFPLQIGVAQPLGTEIGLETARQWSTRNKENTSAILVKIDFSNAFNCVDRQVFLEQCRHQFPGLAQWAEWCYSKPSNLFFGSETIPSEKGVQQGDPIGPLLFALALQPLLLELNKGRSQGLQLVFSYLDDLILAGEQHIVAGAFHFLKSAASRIGLEFNMSKCEVIPAAGQGATITRDLFPDNVIFRVDSNYELLGGPIGSDEYCNQHTQTRVNKAMELLKALGELPDPQVALLLLRHCASFGKLVYSLRVVPH